MLEQNYHSESGLGAGGPRTVMIVLLAVMLSGCMVGQSGTSSRTAVGAFAGSSAVSGEARASALLEALNGGLIAGEIGTDLRSGDRRMALAAEYQALEYASVGQPVSWRGANDRTTGEVTAAAPYRVGSQDCRQYVHTVRVGETTKTARGTACREEDGRWALLS
jgi:surface antigen